MHFVSLLVCLSPTENRTDMLVGLNIAILQIFKYKWHKMK